MSTYNGSRFLREQFDSIISQSYVDWDLYVRDDASTDNTIEIIKEYEVKDVRIHFIEDTVKRGACGGFMWLLEFVDAPFYMFCDQDDVWCNGKIDLTITKMLEQNDVATSPLIVCSDLKVVDAELNTVYESLWKQRHFTYDMFNNKFFHLVYNNVTGCTMMLNKIAKDVSIPYPSNINIHDSWITCSVLWNDGRVVPIDSSTILYRQHSSNAIGTKPVPSLSNQFLRLKSLLTKTKREHSVAYQLTGICFFKFLLVKIYYMLRIHAGKLL
jgi:rhamnosyltransferase